MLLYTEAQQSGRTLCCYILEAQQSGRVMLCCYLYIQAQQSGLPEYPLVCIVIGFLYLVPSQA